MTEQEALDYLKDYFLEEYIYLGAIVCRACRRLKSGGVCQKDCKGAEAVKVLQNCIMDRDTLFRINQNYIKLLKDNGIDAWDKDEQITTFKS